MMHRDVSFSFSLPIHIPMAFLLLNVIQTIFPLLILHISHAHGHYWSAAVVLACRAMPFGLCVVVSLAVLADDLQLSYNSIQTARYVLMRSILCAWNARDETCQSSVTLLSAVFVAVASAAAVNASHLFYIFFFRFVLFLFDALPHCVCACAYVCVCLHIAMVLLSVFLSSSFVS